MRLFVTGASGFVGSAVVPELLAAGHEVVGLARADASADALAAAGAEPHRGALDDLGSLRAAASAADGVIHLAFVHDDFSAFEAAARTDLHAIEAMGDALARSGDGKPLVVVGGALGLAPGRVATEDDVPSLPPASHRHRSARAAFAFADRGVRPSVVRLPPTVHDVGDHGFVPAVIAVARAKGVSGYVGEGANRWSAVHRTDAARAFRLAAESAPAGSVLHAIAEEGVATREIAEAIGRGLGVPTVSIAPDEADAHFGWVGRMLAADGAASSARTRALLGWEPTGRALLADLEAGDYFAEARSAGR